MMKPTKVLQVIVVASTILSIVEFLRSHRIPIFMIDTSEFYNEQCIGNVCNCSSSRVAGPYIAPGPSQIRKLIPMSVLERNMHLDSHNGLRYLDHASLSRFYGCKPYSEESLQSDVKWCSGRSFLDQDSPLVALVSFHGSGNTWLRYMLEQASGIFTGSIYCDGVLKAIFPGESVVSGNVVVIKTHQSDSRKLPKDIQLAKKQESYDKAIVLVRNPFDALVSEANRRWNSKRSRNEHIGLANQANFISNSKWDGLVDYKGVVWGYLLHTWLSQDDVEICVVQYEKLLSNTKEELKKVLNFLKVNVSEERMKCVLENSEGLFKRSEHLNFNPYSTENKEVLNRHMSQALPLLAKYNITYELRL